MTSYDCVVVGGGISGLSVAYGLRRRGAKVLLIELADRVGGLIRSVRMASGYTLECGPSTVMSKDAALWQHFVRLGLMDERLAADRSSARSYILLDGKPELVPSSPQGVLKTPLLSPMAKLRMLAEPLIPRTPMGDESVFAFFARRLGHEMAERLASPFVAGAYLGDPKAMSLRAAFPLIWEMEQHAGSLTLGLIAKHRRGPSFPEIERPQSVLFNFVGGMMAWPQAVARALGSNNIWLNSRPRALRQTGSSWELTVDHNRQNELVSTDVVVLATPAYVTADLVEGLDPMAARALRAIPYPPLSEVHLGYRREAISHPLDGFGVLCPPCEGRQLLGILWPSALFAGNAPEGHVLTTSFMGGARTPEMARKSDADLLALAIREHEQILGAVGAPTMSYLTRWSRALPQYTAGHIRRMAALIQLEAERIGLFLLGNYRDGLSVEQCWNKGIALSEWLARPSILSQYSSTSIL